MHPHSVKRADPVLPKFAPATPHKDPRCTVKPTLTLLVMPLTLKTTNLLSDHARPTRHMAPLSETHLELSHADPPAMPLPLKPHVPTLDPNTVKLADPDPATLLDLTPLKRTHTPLSRPDVLPAD